MSRLANDARAVDRSVDIRPATLNLDSPSCILWGRATRHFVRDFPGLLSIKSIVSGQAVWETDEARHVVDPSGWLLLNHGQRYSLTIESPTLTETFVVFFRRGLVDEAAAALSLPQEKLLDEPACSVPAVLEERVRRHDRAVTPLLRELRAAVHGGSPHDGFLEEKVQALAWRLAAARDDVRLRRSRLSALRGSTRAEILRRLERAVEFLEDNLDKPLRLEQIARVACLSPFHFHRQFTLAFGNPPHRWLMHRRLEEARRLLRESERSVTEVSLDVGFQSLGSFSALFHKHYGMSPSSVRGARTKQD